MVSRSGAPGSPDFWADLKGSGALHKVTLQYMSENRAGRKRSSTVDNSFSVTVVEQIGLAVRWLAVCGVVAYVSYNLEKILVALAGKETKADVLVSFLADVEFNVYVAWGLAAGCILYGAAQARLRRKEIEASHDHIVELERQIERRRTSSRLTNHGDTNPSDK